MCRPATSKRVAPLSKAAAMTALGMGGGMMMFIDSKQGKESRAEGNAVNTTTTITTTVDKKAEGGGVGAPHRPRPVALSSVNAFRSSLHDLLSDIPSMGWLRPTTAKIFSHAFEIGEELGVGAYGTVFQCFNKVSGKAHAVKVVERAKLEPGMEDLMHHEVDIMRGLQHPNIVSLSDSFVDPSAFYLVMELCPGGDLFDRIIVKERFNEEEAKDVMRSLFSALAYAHARGVVHRDLKPENLLLMDGQDGKTLRVADWGMARKLWSSSPYADEIATPPKSGTPGYRAPEVLSGQGEEAGTGADLWAAGVIAFILLSGYNPFDEVEEEEVVVNGDFDYFDDPAWIDVSPQAKDLIKSLLVVDPDHRLTANEALQHEWITGKSQPQGVTQEAHGILPNPLQLKALLASDIDSSTATIFLPVMHVPNMYSNMMLSLGN